MSQDLDHDVGRDRIQPRERLVEDQQIRSVDERSSELNTLLIAMRERLHALVHAIREPEPLQPRAGICAGARVRCAVQDGEVLELIPHAHLGIQPAFFWHVSDPLACTVVDLRAAPRDIA